MGNFLVPRRDVSDLQISANESREPLSYEYDPIHRNDESRSPTLSVGEVHYKGTRRRLCRDNRTVQAFRQNDTNCTLGCAPGRESTPSPHSFALGRKSTITITVDVHLPPRNCQTNPNSSSPRTSLYFSASPSPLAPRFFSFRTPSHPWIHPSRGKTPRVGDEIICIQTPGETLGAFLRAKRRLSSSMRQCLHRGSS